MKGSTCVSVLTARVRVGFLRSPAGRRNREVKCPRAIRLGEGQGENEDLFGLKETHTRRGKIFLQFS